MNVNWNIRRHARSFLQASLISVLSWFAAPTPAAAQQSEGPALGPAMFHVSNTGLGFTEINSANNSLNTAFNVKLADAKGKQADARLIFNDENKNVAVRVADRDFVTVPYDQLDKFSYEFTKKHRITQGAVVMVASLGAGAIVMLTKSKSHWLYIDYHEQNVPKSVVLRMDKNDYKKIFESIKTHTGKDVDFLGDDKDRSKRDKKEKPAG